MIASLLKEVEAFKISNTPYTWASGIQSPFYCDNRLLLSYPEQWGQVITGFCELIKKNYPECNCIAGVATAGIPHAAAIAREMKLPMVYVRSKAKEHGKQNQIEGRLPADAKIVMVEDLISTGGSVIKATEAFDVGVLGVVAIFSYGLKKALKNFEEKKLSYHTLTNLDELIGCFDLDQDSQKLVDQFKSEHC